MTRLDSASHNSNASSQAFNIVGYGVLILGIITIIWSINHHPQSKPSATANKTAVAASTKPDTSKLAIHNFYDCWAYIQHDAKTDPAKCTINGKSYDRPSSFSNDNVRELDKVPSSAKSIVISQAKENFESCAKSSPKAVALTAIKGANERLVYQTSTCGDDQTSILAFQSGKWTKTVLSQGVLSCEVVDKYQIPRSILVDESSKTPSVVSCYSADGSRRAIK